MKTKTLLLSIVLCCSALASLRATHIVGGEMNYTCLGNNDYEITLTIFRDCFYGNPQAWFDDPASVGIFNADNEFLFQELIPLMGNDTLDPILQSECFVVPPDVCVHTTTYRTIVNLPPIPGGYQLAYQRCCRNQTILNIIDPLASGATYGVTISETALLECNSNPKFSTWPPIYICVNEPIFFDQSATDIDGDSIVYRLCDPWLGATPDLPMPQPPNQPPYQPVNWVDPPYNTDNMLNGSPGDPPLSIDSQTGLLTGLPNTIGQFVVGICVEEYRNGLLISTTRRDFQYNVGLCGQASSAFFAPELQCESLTVSFENESQGAGNYHWFFNDPANPGATSNLVDPVFTFSDTGRFEVVLIAEPDTPCADTFAREIYLQYNSLFPDFSYEFVECDDSLTIAVTDLTVDTLFGPEEWTWQLSPLGLTSNDQNPSFTVGISQEYTLRLTVRASNGCVKTLDESFVVDLIEEELPADTLVTCPGGSVPLNPEFDPQYLYAWSPAITLDDASAPSPLASPTETTTYSVTITNAVGICQIEGAVTVFVPEPLLAELPNDTVTCEPEVWLTVATNTGETFEWYTEDDQGTPFATGDSVRVEPLGATTFFVLVRDAYGCLRYDSVTITGNGVNLDLLPAGPICEGDTVGLVAAVTDPTDVVTYDWSPDGPIIVGDGGPLAVVSIATAGNYSFLLETQNQLGCIRTDSLVLNVLARDFEPDFFSEQQCAGYRVQFTGTGVNAPFYVWHFGDPDEPGARALGGTVSYTYPGPGTYEVMITLDESVPCPDTLLREVVVTEAGIVPAFDWTYDTCADTAVIQFTDQSVNNQSTIIEWFWQFGDLGTSNLQNPQLTISQSETIDVTLVLTSTDGCRDTLLQIVELPVIEEEVEETLLACSEEGVRLNPDFNPSYNYSWIPPETLDDPNAPNPLALPAISTIYRVTITDATGECALERQVTVLVPAPIQFDLSPDTIICNASATLQVTSDQDLTYEWATDLDFSSSLGSGPSLTVAPDGLEVYYFRATDGAGCTRIDSVSVGGYGINVLLNGATGICRGDTSRLSVINLGEEPLDYTWLPADSILADGSTGMPLVAPLADQAFGVFIQNEFGCSLDTSIQVSVFDFQPPLMASASPDTLIGPGQTDLTATLDAGYTYVWEPAVLLDAPGIYNPTATLEETTTFTVRIEDANGCRNEASLTVVVLSLECVEPFIYIPNGFTPNGDSQNDRFQVRGNSIDELYLIVYNRWGEKVFETRSPGIGWDGTFRGEALAPDVYGFYVEVRCFNGEVFTKKGNVTLLR